MINTIYTEDFESKVLNSDKPAVVDFYADWCGPCKMLSPILKDLSAEYPGYNFFKVNVDECRELAIHYNIQSIPFLAIFKEGKLVDSLIGFRAENELRDFLTQNN